MDPRKRLLASLTIAAAMASLGTAQAQPRRPLPAHPAHPAPVTPMSPAGEPSDSMLSEARRAYDEGTAQYAAEHYPEALTAFLRAYALRSNPVVLVPIIECHRQLGHVAEELATIEHYLHDAPSAPTRTQLEARLTELRRHPATVHVTSTPPGASLALDGHETGHVAPADLDVTVGRHVVRASLAGYIPVENPIEATPGGHAPIDLTLTAVASAVAVQTSPVVAPVVPTGPTQPVATLPTTPLVPPTPHPVGEERSGFTPVVIGTVIGAGVLFAAASVFGVLAVVDSNTYATAPTRDLYDQGRREALFCDIGLIAGGLTTVVAVVAYVAGRGHHDEAPPVAAPSAASSQWRLSPTGVAVTF